MGFIRALQLGLVAACVAFLALPCLAQGNATYTRIVLGGFSPDGKQLALSYCLSKTNCKTGIFDLARKRFTVITPADKDSFYIPGGISPDGKRLAVTVRRDSDKGAVTQLGLLELATGKLTELTHAPGRRSAPSFSHDGKKVIYAMATRERLSGMTRFSDWDIYELVLKDGNESRLTSFEFFSVTPPAYVGDDEQFIFSGDGPHAYIASSGQRGYEAYKTQHRDNNIFRFKVSEQRNLQPLFSIGRYSSFPVVPFDGSAIAYVAMSHELDGVKHGFTYDLFVFDGKQHRRLTKLNSLIADIVMSSDGSQLAIVAEPRNQLQIRELKLLDVKTGGVEKLDPEAISAK